MQKRARNNSEIYNFENFEFQTSKTKFKIEKFDFYLYYIFMKIFLSTLCFIFFFSPCVFAGSTNQDEGSLTQNSAYTKEEINSDSKSDTQDDDDFFNELIYPDYGSNQSSVFEGREEQNPNQSNYGYDGS